MGWGGGGYSPLRPPGLGFASARGPLRRRRARRVGRFENIASPNGRRLVPTAASDVRGPLRASRDLRPRRDRFPEYVLRAAKTSENPENVRVSCSIGRNICEIRYVRIPTSFRDVRDPCGESRQIALGFRDEIFSFFVTENFLVDE